MEGRRIEGVFLDTAILRNKAYEAYETSRVYEIKILSRVPEALLASLGEPGSRFNATVKGFEQGKVLLMLENGYEVSAENKLSIPIKAGDELSLVLESKEPLTLRVEKSFSGLRGTQELIKTLVDARFSPPLKGSVKELVENSGITYEKKVWDFLRGVLSEENLKSDLKFQTLRALQNTDTQSIENFLKSVKLPPQLERSVSRLLETAQGKDKLPFFRELTNFEREVETFISAREQQLEGVRSTVRDVVRNLVSLLIDRTKPLNIGISVREEVLRNMETNPRAIDVFKEALRNLEEGRLKEFSSKMELLGIRVQNQEALIQHRDRLTSLMRDLVKGASTALSTKMDTDDVQVLARRIKELSEEIERLSDFHRNLTDSLPKDVKENLSRLETIAYMQAFFTSQEGRKFILPFKTEEGKGIMAFSLENSFRVYIKLNFEEGFLGILIEAPKKKEPDSISVVFKTDISALEREIESSVLKLERELNAMGLEVKKIEVLKEEESTFEKEIASELGEKGVFNLRV